MTVTSTGRRRLLLGLQIGLAALGFAVALAVLILARGARPAPTPEAASNSQTPEAPIESTAADARQVTVFAILATPTPGEVDPRLSSVRVQLRKMLPDHGFQLIEARGGRLAPGETLTCDLGAGREAQTTLISHADDEDRVQFLCRLIDGDAPPFSTRVDTPENQLFFYQRPLRDGSLVLIGVGAR